MNTYIVAITLDKGTLKDNTKWEGIRLCVQEVNKNGDARTYIAKAAKDFPKEEVSSSVAESGCFAVSRLLYDRFGRVVGYDID